MIKLTLLSDGQIVESTPNAGLSVSGLDVVMELTVDNADREKAKGLLRQNYNSIQLGKEVKNG